MELTNKIINSFLALCASAALGAGGMYLYNKDKIKTAERYSLTEECAEILGSAGVKLPEGADEKTAVMEGYLKAYDDKYTFYYKKAEKTLQSEIEMVNDVPCLDSCGFRVDADEQNRLRVSYIEPGGTADKQGLKVGDVFLMIDDADVTKDPVEHIRKLYGVDGTVRKFVMARGNEEITVNFKITNPPRDDVEKAVNSKVLEGHILLLKVREMNLDTQLFFGSELSLNSDGCDSLIIDMRNNPGGETTAAVDIAKEFVDSGYVTEYYYTGKTKKIEVASSENKVDLPVVILVNEKTASAAEIFTALLKQNNENVTIVGTNTFGKGCFQFEKELSNGGILRYTAGYYTVGDWECYHGKGISPDIAVEMDSLLIGSDKDVQLEKALSIIG